MQNERIKGSSSLKWKISKYRNICGVYFYLSLFQIVRHGVRVIHLRGTFKERGVYLKHCGICDCCFEINAHILVCIAIYTLFHYLKENNPERNSWMQRLQTTYSPSYKLWISDSAQYWKVGAREKWVLYVKNPCIFCIINVLCHLVQAL